MKLECILIREGGTFVNLGEATYHFAPQEDGRHVAEVNNEAHIERLLQIPEAYRIYRTNPIQEPQPVIVPPADEPDEIDVDPAELVMSKAHPATFVIEGKAYTLTDVTKRAFIDSGLTVEAWNELDDETRATKTDIVLDSIAEGEIEIEEADGKQDGGGDDREELKALYKARFGEDPGRMRTETIKAKLAAAE